MFDAESIYIFIFIYVIIGVIMFIIRQYHDPDTKKITKQNMNLNFVFWYFIAFIWFVVLWPLMFLFGV
jgi:hypothetical protein